MSWLSELSSLILYSLRHTTMHELAFLRFFRLCGSLDPIEDNVTNHKVHCSSCSARKHDWKTDPRQKNLTLLRIHI